MTIYKLNYYQHAKTKRKSIWWKSQIAILFVSFFEQRFQLTKNYQPTCVWECEWKMTYESNSLEEILRHFHWIAFEYSN